MIILTDTFNNRIISRHFTVKAAVIKKRKHLAAVKKANGANSYLTYSITCSSGRDIYDEVLNETVKLNDL